MEEAIKFGIYIHAFFGGIGLLAGTIGFSVKKGGKWHRLAGKWFSVGMITSSLLSMPIAILPGHENTFLFLIALFTIYLVLAGNRALTFKPRFRKTEANLTDKLVSGSMFCFSVLMLGYGAYHVYLGIFNAMLFIFFGGIGFFMSYRDFAFYKNAVNHKNGWLVNHIGRIVGAYIASITAFIVAGLSMQGLVYWITPTVLGTMVIVYWIRRVKNGFWVKPKTSVDLRTLPKK